MERFSQTLISIALSIVLITFGSVGYMTIEGWQFFDAMYMTVITLATVGYGEVHEISNTGRLFTVFLIFLGVGYFLYVVGNVIQFLVEGRIRLILGRHKLDKQINRVKDHYIVCGYGRIGRVLSQYLIEKYLDVVVVENDEKCTQTMNDDGVLYLLGEAGDEKILIQAGIKRAKGLVTVVGSDAENVFTVLMAKQLNPKIFVVSRVIQESARKTLIAAGANKVISPYELGARRMAHAILRPTVIKFLELAFADEHTDIQVEEITIKSKSKMVGTSLLESGIRQELNLLIIAIRKPDGDMKFNPKADTIFETDDTVVAVGRAKSLLKLQRLLRPTD
ncbi:MAG: potassium channel protein [Desulfobacteraceae bacterium]|nr:potassium channel protein [Desulfobacteraceae bacterium]